MDVRLIKFFGYGFAAGLVVVAYAVWSAWRRRRELQAEVRRLREHLHAHMELTHEGSTQRKNELEELKRQNENLRVTLKALRQKPDRRELRMLHVYDHAVRQLMLNAPGFASHWENAIRDAEQAVEQVDRGLLAYARRLVLPRRESSDGE